MSGERGLRWPLHARAQLAGALLAVLVPALVVLATHAAALLPASGGSQPAASSTPTALRMSTALPEAALGPVSATVGAAEPSYHVRVGAGGARAVNRGQGFVTSFTAGGVRVSSKSLGLSIHTTAAGFGSSPAAVAPAQPRASSNRVTYDRPGMQEWYANGPFGLEQGFNIDRPTASAARAGGLYTVTIALSGTTRPFLTQHGRAVALQTHSGALLRYGGLRALDASGRPLPSWMSLQGQTLSLHVRTAGASFPISIDPFLTNDGLAIELGEGPGEAPEKPQFGTDVALSGDGTTALVGAPAGESHTGAAWIFHREGARWSQQGPKLTSPKSGQEGVCEGEEILEEPEEPVSCAFGTSVALDYEGDTALIGAPHRGASPGVAWVLNRTGSTWTKPEETEPLVGRTEVGQEDFGFSVALSRDGNEAMVGAPNEHGGKGAAYVFEHVNSEWKEAGLLLGKEEGPSGHLGFSVALSSNGQEAIAGAPLDALHKGTAFVFEHGISWVQSGLLSGAGESGEGRFGESVAMSGDGSTVIVGAPDQNNKLGAVWTFTFGGGRWSELPSAKLFGPGDPKEEFGRSVALSENGAFALVGAPKANARERGVGAGSVTFFEAKSFGWSEVQAVEAGPLEKGNGQFGKSASMTASGQTILVGAPHESFKAGAVWLFGKRPTVEALKSPPEGKGKAKGHLSGGNKVMILGKNLAHVVAVWFGDSKALEIGRAEPVSQEEREAEEKEGKEPQGQEQLLVVAPPGGEQGVVEVIVETDNWRSAEKTSDQYEYVIGPGEQEGGGGGGSGPKNKHHGNENGIPIEDLFKPPVTGTTSATGKNGVSGNQSSGSASCRVSLRSSKVSVASHSRAMIALAAHGSGRCGGHLSLQVRVKRGRHTLSKTIASGTYVASAGRNLTVALHLNSTGQALLRSGHGHLKARLLVGRTYPTALKASATNVTLSNAKKKR